jgi:hypothetical protein
VVVLDILHVLMAEDKVVLVKMNPVNDYYGPLIKQVRAPGTAQYVGVGGWGGGQQERGSSSSREEQQQEHQEQLSSSSDMNTVNDYYGPLIKQVRQRLVPTTAGGGGQRQGGAAEAAAETAGSATEFSSSSDRAGMFGASPTVVCCLWHVFDRTCSSCHAHSIEHAAVVMHTA